MLFEEEVMKPQVRRLVGVCVECCDWKKSEWEFVFESNAEPLIKGIRWGRSPAD